MLAIRDYEGNEYPLYAVKKHNIELDGQEDLELTVPQQNNSNLDLKQVDKLWEIIDDTIDYKIVYVKQQTKGHSFYLEIRAIPLFYWEMDKQIIHANHDGSHTANDAFRIVFNNSGYQFVLVDFSPSVEMEGFGKGETRLERFKTLLDRYNYEFDIQGSTVYMRHLVGNDTNFMYKYKLNASNVSRTTDATAMFTHIKGFGNFEEGEEDYYNNAKLKRQYTSPLADIVTRPGKEPDEGKPIVDGRVKNASKLDEMMKKSVDESLQINVEGNLHDIRKMGYTVAVPKKGDRIFLIDERINLKTEIRVQSVTTTYDVKGNIIDCEVSFGSESIKKRYKASINSLSKNFSDLLTGQLKLPIISLEKIGMDMINAIHAASSEIVFGDFGMQAISKSNPNHVFGVNSEGWYISQDGGRTPRTIATAQGIYADALFAGTLWLTNEMNIESADGYLNVTGSRFIMRSKTNPNNAVEITPDGITIYGYDGREYFINGLMSGKSIIQLQRFENRDTETNGSRDVYIRTDTFTRVYVIYDQWKGNRLDLMMFYGLTDGSNRGSGYFKVRVVNMFNGETIATQRLVAWKNPDDGQDYTRLNLDLKKYYNAVVDYRNLHLYIEVMVEEPYHCTLRYRINKSCGIKSN